MTPAFTWKRCILEYFQDNCSQQLSASSFPSFQLCFLRNLISLNSFFHLVILDLRDFFFFKSPQNIFWGFQFQRSHLVKGNLHVGSGGMEGNLGDHFIFS